MRGETYSYGRVIVGADGLLELKVQKDGCQLLGGAVVHAALLEALDVDLPDLVERGVAPAGDRLVLRAKSLKEGHNLTVGQRRVQVLALLGNHDRKELPHHAVVARDGVEVGLARLVGGAMRDETRELGAALRVVREGREPAAESSGYGLELALGWVLEEVLLDDARDELLV